MKKLLFVLFTLFAIVLLTGCGNRENTVRFNSEGEPLNEIESEEAAETEEADEEEALSEDTKSEEAIADGEGEADEDKEVVAKTETKKEVKTVTKASERKLSVTSLKGAYLDTSLSYNVIKGEAPEGTRMIKVNDYKLSKYIGGQTQWDFIASTRFGTLKDGLNSYVVKAYDAEGEEIDSVMFSINYEAPAVPEVLPGVGASHWFTLLSTLMIAFGMFSLFRKQRWL